MNGDDQTESVNGQTDQLPPDMAVAQRPSSDWSNPGWTNAPPASTSKQSLPRLNVERAIKGINYFSQNPQWFGNPRTRHVAESLFNRAGDVIAKHVQLENFARTSENALTKNQISKKVSTALFEMTKSSKSGAAAAAKWFAVGDDGAALYQNPANAGKIFEDYRTHVNTDYDAELANSIRKGDKISAEETSALLRARSESGWTPENAATLSKIRGGLNERLAAEKKTASEFGSTAGKEVADRIALEKKFGVDSPQVKKFDELTAKSSSLSNLGKLLRERKDASPEDQAQYDRVIGHIGEKMGVSMQQDDQGRWIVNYGPQQGTVGTASVATQSMAQRKLLKYEAASELINHLQKNMGSGDVGLSGVLGEYVGDRILPQLGVDTFKGKRADVRSTLIAARESLLREISDDTRFSNADREEISKALPSSGVFESLPNAQQRLETVRNILNARGRTYSEGLGLKQPEWSLSPDEIKAQYEKHEATGGKEGMSFEKAKSLLERFHHFQP